MGARPHTRIGLPHIQLNQWPPAEIAKQLVDSALGIPGVRAKQSRMAFPSSLALCLDDDSAHGPPEAFIDSHEFCLLHSLPEGTVHLTLPPEVRDAAIRQGWAEPHPGVRAAVMPDTLVMVYAPRDSRELSVVFRLITVSSRLAKGEWPGRTLRRALGGVLSWAG